MAGVTAVCRSLSRWGIRSLNTRVATSRLFSTEEASPRGPPYTTSLSTASSPAKAARLHPVYRVMGQDGLVLDKTQDPNLSDDTLLSVYQKMVTLTYMDEQLYKAQRMGLISFYMMCSGEEAVLFGTAVALDSADEVYSQYREAGVIMWRGFTLDNFMNQCFSNEHDSGKGRQMPVHYGSKDLHFQYISSPLATQMTQASGYAYGLKRAGAKNCVVCYFGDGAAQEGDAHAALNFGATLDCPVIFVCRNNGYAISTPVEEQYKGDGIVSRGAGYGMEAIRVDGNDFFAMYNATVHARKVCVEEHRPVLLEAMTYRLASHSTSDDQTSYQDMEEVSKWKQNHSPVTKLMKYIINRGIWSEEKNATLIKSIEADIKTALQKARKQKAPAVDHLFTDVYDTMPKRLMQQKKELEQLVAKYPQHYPLDRHAPSDKN